MRNKQIVFIAEYLKDFNATQAAIRAGYSKKTARSIGCELLTIPNISGAIKAEITERSMSAEEVIQRLSDIARGNIVDLMDVRPTGYDFDFTWKDENTGEEVPNPHMKLVKRIKQKVTTIQAKSESGEDKEIIDTELELYSAQEALNTLAKYHNLLIDHADLTSGGKPIGIATVSPDLLGKLKDA